MFGFYPSVCWVCKWGCVVSGCWGAVWLCVVWMVGEDGVDVYGCEEEEFGPLCVCDGFVGAEVWFSVCVCVEWVPESCVDVVCP